MDNNKKPEEKKEEPKVKRLGITLEEKQRLDRCYVIMDSLIIQTKGIEMIIKGELAMIRRRLKIDEETVPAGYVRSVSFDDNKYQLVIEDVKLAAEPTVKKPDVSKTN